MGAKRREATYDDLLRVPEHFVAEVIGGELFANPRPAVAHAIAGGALFGDLREAFHRGRRGPGGWWLMTEPELHLGADVLVPDIAGWRRERMPVPPRAAALDLAPDWICEIISPTTAALDRTRKLPVYARHDVRHSWIVDPLAYTLEVYRLEEGRWLLLSTHSGQEVVRAEPFDAVELELGALWLPEAAQ